MKKDTHYIKRRIIIIVKEKFALTMQLTICVCICVSNRLDKGEQWRFFSSIFVFFFFCIEMHICNMSLNVKYVYNTIITKHIYI